MGGGAEDVGADGAAFAGGEEVVVSLVFIDDGQLLVPAGTGIGAEAVGVGVEHGVGAQQVIHAVGDLGHMHAGAIGGGDDVKAGRGRMSGPNQIPAQQDGHHGADQTEEQDRQPVGFGRGGGFGFGRQRGGPRIPAAGQRGCNRAECWRGP